MAVLMAVCGLASCERAETSDATTKAAKPSPANSPAVASMHLNRAQPKLQTMKLWLGPKEIVAELALNRVQIETGMMFRKQMGEDEGMLFVFAQPHRTSFYMKNTLIPLTCAYIDAEGAIAELHDLEPKNETPVPARSDNIQYVLEMNRGWFQKNKIGVGTVVRTEHGTLPETFFKKRP